MTSKVYFTSNTARQVEKTLNDNFDDLESRAETLEAKTHTSDFTNDGSGTEFEEVSGYSTFTTTSDYVGYYVLVSTTYTKVTNSNKDSLNITAGTTKAYQYSPYATRVYVDENGGKIDSISVNNVTQTIDANKNVNITVPTKESDLTNDRAVRYDINNQGLNSTQQGNARTNIDAQQTINSSNKLSADNVADGTTNKVYTATEQSKLSGIESGAQVNVIESVKSGNNTFTPSSKAVDIQGVDNLTNYYTKSDIYTKTEIDGMVSSVYKPAGSVAFASLPTLSSSVLGNVYSVTDSFTIDSRFVEYSSGTTKTYPAGTNVVVVNTGTSQSPTYMFDVLSGFVDLSGYVPTSRKVNSKALTSDISLSASDVGAEPTISSKGTAFNQNFETSTSNIKMDGTASVGSSNNVARADHIHPSDTSKQDTLSSTNKLNADYIQDGTTNKVVTATEKSTWNGKQDAYSTLTFTASDAGWSSADSDGFYTLTITSAKKPIICFDTNGEQIMAGLKSDGTNVYVIADAKFAGSVLAF